MKLVNFRIPGQPETRFGFYARERVFSFQDAPEANTAKCPDLKNIRAYLAALPVSERQAREMEALAGQGALGEGYALNAVRILPPLTQPSLFIDFALAPRHLENAAHTLFKRSRGPLAAFFARRFISRGIKKKNRARVLSYYKANSLTVSGPEDEIVWPEYTCYLDIEPELAVITGSAAQPIAGYTIFNDWSARDVQLPEMIGTGPNRSKDFAGGNGLGPFLVTPDEIPDPRALQASVKVGTRFHWQGSTREYSHSPEEVLSFLNGIFPLCPGMVIGMGTLPGCCGVDQDLWMEPGDSVEIDFEKLGILSQTTARRALDFTRSPWGAR